MGGFSASTRLPGIGLLVLYSEMGSITPSLVKMV
jgi:hypothetical protein